MCSVCLLFLQPNVTSKLQILLLFYRDYFINNSSFPTIIDWVSNNKIDPLFLSWKDKWALKTNYFSALSCMTTYLWQRYRCWQWSLTVQTAQGCLETEESGNWISPPHQEECPYWAHWSHHWSLDHHGYWLSGRLGRGSLAGIWKNKQKNTH